MVDRIFKLMEEKGVNATTLTKDAGLTNGLITQWKQGKQKPSTDAVVKIAAYFGVTTDYLLTGSGDIKKEQIQPSSSSMHDFIMNNPELTEEGRQIMLSQLNLVKKLETARAENKNLDVEFSTSIEPLPQN